MVIVGGVHRLLDFLRERRERLIAYCDDCNGEIEPEEPRSMDSSGRIICEECVIEHGTCDCPREDPASADTVDGTGILQ
jgi:hypothetical protein